MTLKYAEMSAAVCGSKLGLSLPVKVLWDSLNQEAGYPACGQAPDAALLHRACPTHLDRQVYKTGLDS